MSYFILLALEKTVDGYVRLEHFAYNPHLYAYYSWWDRSLKKSELSRALKRLREQGLIEEDKIGNDVIFKLTDQGRDLTFGLNLEPDDWDGRWRIVIWDIPEQKRLVRDLFRRNLKKWGFKQVQKSVWATKKDMYRKLIGYIQELGLGKWVTVIETDKVSNNAIIINDR